MCGLRIGVAEGEVTKIRPDEDDVWSRGYICPKGTTLGDLHHDPDRLRAPLVKHGGKLPARVCSFRRYPLPGDGITE